MLAAALERDLLGIADTRPGHGSTTPPASVRLPWRPTVEHLLALLDQLDTGFIVVDAHARILLANEAARHEISDGGVLQREDGVLSVDGPSLLKLRRAVAEAVESQRHDLLNLRSGDHTLIVAVQPLRTRGHAPLALVLLQRRQVCPDLAIEMLASQHALTLAEKRVLSGLLQGRRVQALAAEHRVQVSTVRSQVAALRTKFGVQRLEDLVRLAAELPPMAPMMAGLLPQRSSVSSVRVRRPPRTKAKKGSVPAAAPDGDGRDG